MTFAHSPPGLYSTFADRAALDKYAVSEEHVKVVTENVRPNVDGTCSVLSLITASLFQT
jgi:hypothetical protein